MSSTPKYVHTLGTHTRHTCGTQKAQKFTIFVPDVWHFCACCVHVRCAPTCGSYSPEHGDVPRYPNLAKIPKIRRCSSPYSWLIFSFWEKNCKEKKFSFCSAWHAKMNLSQQITIRMLWNRNLLLTNIMCTSGLLLMTFWREYTFVWSQMWEAPGVSKTDI